MSGAGGPTLAVNAQRLLGSRAGVGRYLSELLRQWADLELPFEQVTLYAPRPIPRDALPAEHPYRLAVVPGRGPAGAWEHVSLPRAAAGADVLFCPSYVVPLTWRGAAVVTTHDVMQEVVSKTFPWHSRGYRAHLYRRSARRASIVLTDSGSSKRDIERIYGVPGERVRAVALGVDPAFAAASEEDERRVRTRLGLDGPVVLFVGKFSRRRNLPTLVRAFARARHGAARDATLVLAGSDHLGLKLDALGAELGLGDALCLPGYVPDGDLPALYRAASVFAYPSDYEGFGLPPLEAMAAGTPVLALDNSSVAEVVGDAGVLLPTATVEGLAGELERLLGDPALRDRYAREGRERAKRFTWEATADATLKALTEAAGGSVARPARAGEGIPMTATGRTARERGMPHDYYARIATVERAHWWHRGMREIAAALLGARLDAPGLGVCDVGCGTGGVLRWVLARNPDARVAGADISAEAVSLARARVPDADLEVAPMHDMPFEDASFDVLVTNDVVQHVPEPQLEASATELRRLLAPGGVLLVRTNGGRRLERVREDWRRYDARALREWLEDAGMGVERVTYANFAGSVWATLRGAGPRAPTQERYGIPPATGARARDPRFLTLRAEAAWLAKPGRTLPHGHTLFSLATRGA